MERSIDIVADLSSTKDIYDIKEHKGSISIGGPYGEPGIDIFVNDICISLYKDDTLKLKKLLNENFKEE